MPSDPTNTIDPAQETAGGKDDYVVGSSDEELRRLLRQHALFRPACERAWHRAGLTAGMRVLDVGAGPGAAALDLAARVGRNGAVAALERNRRFVAHCQAVS